MMRDLLWLAVILMTVNAGLAVLSVQTTPVGETSTFAREVFDDSGALGWTPTALRYSSLDSNNLDANVSLLTPVESPGFLTSVSQTLSSLPLVGEIWTFVISAIGWVKVVYGILVLLVAGMLIFLTEIGAPAYIVFLFGIPTTIINAGGMLALLSEAVNIVRGVKVI